MESISDFFVNPLIYPFYVGLALYGFAWIVGRFFFAGVFIRGLGTTPGAIERGTLRAWRLMAIIHLLLLTFFVIGLSIHALPRVSNWPRVFLYLIAYVPFLVADICILATLKSHGTKPKRNVDGRNDG